MKSCWTALVAVLATLSSAGCGVTERPQGTQLAILGGADAPADTAVVAIVNFSGGQCSGSLITPELVLTARHCVADTAGKERQVLCGKTEFQPADSAGAIFVVPLPEISDDPQDYLATSDVRMPPGLGDDLCGTDVVLLRLKQPLLGITPLVPRLDEPVNFEEQYSAVGFGLDESLPGKPSGVRKRLDQLTVTCSGSECGQADVRDNEWVGSGGPCSGDSGGPALDADGRVIGVVSRGQDKCRAPVFSDVATRADWLRSEAIAAADALNRAPPDWARRADEPGASEPAASCDFSPAGAAGSWGRLGALGLWLTIVLARRQGGLPGPNNWILSQYGAKKRRDGAGRRTELPEP